MGRPLNKKFFGDGAGLIACTARIGGGNELCYIVSQRSNSQYEVESEAGPATRAGFARLVQGAPGAEEEMQVTVQAENAVATLQATVTFLDAAGALDSITSFVAGYGYWAPGTGVVVAGGGGDGTVDYTVANGYIVTMAINAVGSGYSSSTQNIADAPDTDPPLESARIINARQVKTFEGNTFDWPITSPLGSPGPGTLTQADLQSQ